jgi:hypothetical protein
MPVSYELTWYAAEEVLHLNLQSTLSLEEMKLINQRIVDILDESKRKLILLIDVSAFTAGYTTVDYLRDTQKYRDHPNLDVIAVVSNNKLNQLITLLVFSLSHARFIRFDSREKAQLYIAQRGILESQNPQKTV